MKTLEENNSENNSVRESTNGALNGTIEVVQDGSFRRNSYSQVKPKTPLKKDELEKIARELKKKLTKASITAKQSLSPTNMKVRSLSRSSPLKGDQVLTSKRFSGSKLLNSSPDFYSPNGKSPTQWKTAASVYLSSSPLKEYNSSQDPPSSPSERKGETETTQGEMDIDSKENSHSQEDGSAPQMILEAVDSAVSTPSKKEAPELKPSPTLNIKKQTTPTLSKRQLTVNSNVTPGILMRTPTQPKPGSSSYYNDDEGAGLLMYLATSPSPARPHSMHTPKAAYDTLSHGPSISLSSPNNSHSNQSRKPQSSSSSYSFMAPPLTPKRHINVLAKTPQGRQTPSANLFNNFSAAGGLPSSGLSLTPAGFNMNDYVNFFTPSPNGANLNHHNSSMSKTFLKTPDFGSIQPKQTVDGTMINFDKVELFGNSTTNERSSKE